VFHDDSKMMSGWKLDQVIHVMMCCLFKKYWVCYIYCILHL
jgi:hypothetical protein